jgi:hypothetical protein
MYLLDQSLFFPLVGHEFDGKKLENFDPTNLCERYGPPVLLKNLENDIDKKGERSILKEIFDKKSRFQYLISDSLSYLGKFMIFDLSDVDKCISFYKKNSKSDVYNSTVFFDGTDLVFISTNFREAFAVDHDYNFMTFSTSVQTGHSLADSGQQGG